MRGDGAADDEQIDLRAYLTVFRRRWTTFASVVLVIVSAAVAFSVSRPTQYRAEADVLLRPQSTEPFEGTEVNSAQDTARLLNNEVKVLESGAIRELVRASYDGLLDVDDVSASAPVAASDVVTVSTVASDADEAARLVNVYIKVFIEARHARRVDQLLATGARIQDRISDLNEQISAAAALSPELQRLEAKRTFYVGQLQEFEEATSLDSTAGAEVLTIAEAPEDPVSPTPTRDAAVGLGLGLILGVALAFVVDHLDDRMRSLADVERATNGIPVLAIIPRLKRKLQPGMVVRDSPRSPGAEAYRALRTAVRFGKLDGDLSAIQVTSCGPNEAKTTTVANLALAIAQEGAKVAIVDCDLRKPRIHELFGEPVAPGLSDVLAGEELVRAIRKIDATTFLLPAGSVPPNPSEVLAAEAVEAIVSALTKQFDIVLIDSPPVLPVTDALVVSRMVDATLVVVYSRTTKQRALRRTLQLLSRVRAPVLGVVLSGVRPDDDQGYGYGYGYGHTSPSQPTSARSGLTRRQGRSEPAPIQPATAS